MGWSNRRRGATAVAYGLLVGLIAVALLSALAATGGSVSALFDRTANRLQGGPSAADAPAAPALPPVPAPAQLAMSPSAQALPIQAQALPTQGGPVSFTVRNGGGGPTGALAVTVTSGLSLAGDSCSGRALQPQEDCTLAVLASLADNTGFTGTATVGDGAASVSGTVVVTGDGFVPHLTVGQPQGGFDISGGETQSACVTLTVGNDGFADIADLQQGAVQGPDAAHFTACAAGGTACGDTLAAGAECTLGVRMQASENGSYTAGFVLSGGGQEVEVPLNGTATGLVAHLGWTDSNGAALSARSGLDVAGPGSPASGAAVQLRLRNGGPAAAQGVQVALAGSGFAVDSSACSGSLAAGADCSVAVVPQASGNGALSAILNASASGAATAALPLSGTASGWAPQLALANGAGSVAVANISNGVAPGACTELSLANTGSAPAELGFALSTTAFALCTATTTPCGAQLAAGASCRLGVRLATSANGSYSATLTATPAGFAARAVTVTGTVSGGTFAAGYLLKTGVWDYGDCAGGDSNMCPTFGYVAKNDSETYSEPRCASGIARCTETAVGDDCVVASYVHRCE